MLGALDMTQAEIARRIGVRQPTIAGWISGQHVPKPHHRRALRDAFGIPFEAWPADAEAEELREQVRTLQIALKTTVDEAAELLDAVFAVVQDPEVLARICDRLSDTIRR